MTRWMTLCCLLLLLSGCTMAAAPPATQTPDPDWETYAADNGRFTVDFRRSIPLQTRQQDSVIDGDSTIIHVIQASYLDSDRQAVTYFQHPGLVSGSLSPAAYLETFDLGGFGSAARLENVQETAVQLGPHPGREWTFQLSDETVLGLNMRVRVYVVEDTIYQLTLGSLISATDAAAERFFNSFTLNP